MADARSTYDETNEVWPYFLVTLFLLVLVPVTVSEVLSLWQKQPKRTHSRFAGFNSQLQHKQRVRSVKIWLIAGGWLLLAAFVQYIRTSEPAGDSLEASSGIWDPYAILKLSHGAPLKEIKSAYRKLSLEFHPDKVKDVAGKAREEIEAIYVEISKAHRALTDDVTRENYLQYGHPDGPQPVKHGIALPAFLFNPAASTAYILAYLVGFGVGIPVVVSAWWSSSLKRTRKGLLQATATQFSYMLAKEQAHFFSQQRLLDEVLSSADITESLSLFSNKKLSLEERHAILQSYLTRQAVSKGSAGSEAEHLELQLASETVRVLDALHSIATYFKSAELCSRILVLRRAIVQAVPLNQLASGEYLQLDGADYAEFEKVQSSDKAEVRKAGAEEVQKVVSSAKSYLPRLAPLSANFRVRGEEKVPVNSQMFLEVKFLVVPVGETVPELSAKEIDALSKAEDAANEGSKAATAAGANLAKYLDTINRSKPKVGAAHTPHFPREVEVSWYIYLSGMNDNKLMEDPYEITHMDLHNLKLTSAQLKSGDDLVIGTAYVPLKSASPPKPASVSFKVAMLSTAYFGTDLRAVANMQVVEAAPLPAPAADELEDSSDEEDIEGLSDLDTDTEDEEEAEAEANKKTDEEKPKDSKESDKSEKSEKSEKSKKSEKSDNAVPQPKLTEKAAKMEEAFKKAKKN